MKLDDWLREAYGIWLLAVGWWRGWWPVVVVVLLVLALCLA